MEIVKFFGLLWNLFFQIHTRQIPIPINSKMSEVSQRRRLIRLILMSHAQKRKY